MGVGIETAFYYCFRRPQHAGKNLVALLVKLGADRSEAIRLHNKHLTSKPIDRSEQEVKPALAQLAAWEAFAPAADYDRPLDYLASRGFDDPEMVANRYDIRYDPKGKDHKGRFRFRVLLPIKERGAVVAWTGRGINKDAMPKYLTESSGREGLVYQPRAHRHTLIICEGPLDALKLAVAGERMPMSAVALTGKQLNDDRLAHLLDGADEVAQVLLCLDQDTAIWEASRMLAELTAAFRGRVVRRIKLPEDFKDPGEMALPQANSWLKGLAA
jgi:DNA primase